MLWLKLRDVAFGNLGETWVKWIPQRCLTCWQTLDQVWWGRRRDSVVCTLLYKTSLPTLASSIGILPSGMRVVSIRERGIPVLIFLFVRGESLLLSKVKLALIHVYVSGSVAATCKYDCEQTGGCTAKYSGPPRSGNTIVSSLYFLKIVSLHTRLKWKGLLELWRIVHIVVVSKPVTLVAHRNKTWAFQITGTTVRTRRKLLQK